MLFHYLINILLFHDIIQKKNFQKSVLKILKNSKEYKNLFFLFFAFSYLLILFFVEKNP